MLMEFKLLMPQTNISVVRYIGTAQVIGTVILQLLIQ